jgi:Na+-transporting NADH:ubiquinone oxidoreductase subunit NqrC
MKPPQFVVAVVLSLVPLVLVITLIFMGQKNQTLQAQLQTQQEAINQGSMSQQIGTNLLKEIAQASVKDDKLKDVLTRAGFSVSVNASPTPASSRSSSSSETH